MKITKCVICDNETNRLTLDLRYCSVCGHIFKDVWVDKNSYKNYRSSAHAKLYKDSERNIKEAVDIRFNVFKYFAKPGTVLEIGSGHKYFLDKLKDNGFEPEGTELSEAMIKEIDYKIYLGNPSDIPDLKVYDNICAFHVVEHLNEPIKELTYLVNHMSDDGVFLMEVPSLILFTNSIHFHIRDVYEPLHTQYFGQSSLNLLLDRVGLKPVFQINLWEGVRFPGTMIVAVKKTRDLNDILQGTTNYLKR